MTVTTSHASNYYTAATSQTAFSITFEYFDANKITDIWVYADGVKQTYTTHFTIASGVGAQPDTGTLNFVVAPGNGVKIAIIRHSAIDQQTFDMGNSQSYFLPSLEIVLDTTVMVAQEMLEARDHALSYNMATDVALWDLNLPDPVADAYIKWNATADGIEHSPLPAIPHDGTTGKTGTGPEWSHVNAVELAKLIAYLHNSLNTLQGGTTAEYYHLTAAEHATLAVLLAGGVMVYKGETDASSNPDYPVGVVGDTYSVTVAGRIGGAAGRKVEVETVIVCKSASVGGTQASVGTDWFITGHKRYVFATAPVVGNDDADTNGDGTIFLGGETWLDTSTNKSYICLDATTGTAVWKDPFSAANILLESETGTDHNVQQMQDLGHSAGITSAVDLDSIITAETSTTVQTTEFKCYLRTSDSVIATLKSYTLAAATGLSCPTANTNYYIMVDYNGGSPVITAETTDTTNGTTLFVLGEVFNQSGTVYEILNIPIRFNNHSYIMNQRNWEVYGPQRAFGIVLSEKGTRNLGVTAGKWFARFQTFLPVEFDSSVSGTWAYYYSDGASGWTEVSASTQINNTQYDDGSGTLATLSNNKYGAHWVFSGITDGHVRVLYGQTDEALTTTKDSLLPAALPPLLGDSKAYKLIGRVIIQKGASVFTEVSTVKDDALGSSAGAIHNELGGLQGGATDDYQHLTTLLLALLTEAVTISAGAGDAGKLALLDASGQWDPSTVPVSGSVVHNDTTSKQGGTTAEYYHLTSAQHVIATQAASAILDGYVNQAAQTFTGVKDFDSGITLGAGTDVLDVYEEGSWTPAIATLTLTVSDQSYTKIGNMITVGTNFEITSGTPPGGTMLVTGLPEAPATILGSISIMWRDVSASNAHRLGTGYIHSTGLIIDCDVDGQVITTGDTIYLTATYFV